MAATKTSFAGIALAAIIVVAVVVGFWRSVADRAPDAPVGGPPATAVATTPAPYEHFEDEGPAAEPTPTGPAPTNVPGSGTDAEGSDLTPALRSLLVKRATAFWAAFSLRDPQARDDALAGVTVPYLAERMSVRSTARIPQIKPVRSVVVDGSFSQATVVSETAGNKNNWWYVTLVLDPATETWSAQAYEEASPGLIAAARAALQKSGTR